MREGPEQGDASRGRKEGRKGSLGEEVGLSKREQEVGEGVRWVDRNREEGAGQGSG